MSRFVPLNGDSVIVYCIMVFPNFQRKHVTMLMKNLLILEKDLRFSNKYLPKRVFGSQPKFYLLKTCLTALHVTLTKNFMRESNCLFHMKICSKKPRA